MIGGFKMIDMGMRFQHLVDLMETVSARGCALGVGFIRGVPSASHFSYAPEFLRRYEDLELSRHDQTLQAGFASDGIYSWLELEREIGPSKAMNNARDFGMVDGLCFATTVNGMKSIGSISLTVPASEVVIDRGAIMAALELASIEVTRQRADAVFPLKLKAYLELVSRGHSTDEIAAELSISVAGVRKRQKACLEKLGARSLPNAVAIAVTRGLLPLYQNV